MTTSGPDYMDKARRARDQLAQQLSQQPGVSLIDIGFDPESTADPKPVVVRVHLRRLSDQAALGIPAEIDGVPVRVVQGDYRLE